MRGRHPSSNGSWASIPNSPRLSAAPSSAAPRIGTEHAFEMGRDVAHVRRRLAEAQQVSDPSVTQNTTVSERPRVSPTPAKKSDSARQKILTPERFAELQRQQVEEHLRFGEEALAKGDHDAALHYGERAAMVDPDSRSAIDLIHRARLAIDSKAIRKLLVEAQRKLSDGHIDAAAALADEAEVALPNLEGAGDLRAEVHQFANQVAAARERERRISTSLDRARASIEQGGYDTALRAVYEILALDPDQTEARELEKTAIARLQAQREHARVRRQAYDRLSSARALANEGRHDEALEAIAGVDGPSDTVRIAAAQAAAEVRTQQRQAQVAAVIADARRAFERGEFEHVLAAIDAIPGDDLVPDARALRADAERGLQVRIELERKRAAVEDGLRATAALVEQNDLSGAAAKLEEIERIGLADPRIPEQRERIATLVAAAQERRRQEARDRLAAKLVESALQLLENGDGYAAVALLERDGSSHPLVSDALRRARATVAEQEERARQEAERRRQEQEARKRAELEAARKREEARLAEEQRKRDEERRVREAEIERRRQEYARLLAAAEDALASDPEQATLLLKRADLVGRVDDSGLAERAAAVRAEAERLERERAEEARREAEARRREEEKRRRAEEARRKEVAFVELLGRARQSPDHEAALDMLREALVLLPGDRRAEALASERGAALDAERAEAAQRAEEARRAEEEAQHREAAVTMILSRERHEPPEAALTLLQDALTIVPGDQRVEARIAQRNADLERQRLEAERQRQIALAVSAVTAALERKDLDGAERLIKEGERQFDAAAFRDVHRTCETMRREEARVRREAEEAQRRERERQAREEAERRAREEAERARLEREELARQAP